MSSGCTVSGISNLSSSGRSAGAPRESLSIWSSRDDSDSVHGSGDEYDGMSGCGGFGSECTGSGQYFLIISFRVDVKIPFAAICALFSKFSCNRGLTKASMGSTLLDSH